MNQWARRRAVLPDQSRPAQSTYAKLVALSLAGGVPRNIQCEPSVGQGEESVP